MTTGCGFMRGFYKRAADAAKKPPKKDAGTGEAKEPAGPVDQAGDEAVADVAGAAADPAADPAAGQVRAPLTQQPVEKMLKWDALGGVSPRTPEDMQAAQAVDLITLPADVEGANCGNCMHARILDEEIGHGFCTHPEVKQDVTPRMCCARWEAPGQIRAWEQEDASAVPDPSIMQEADQVAQGQMPFDPELATLPGEMPLEQGDAAGAGGGGAEVSGAPQAAQHDKEDANAKAEPKKDDDKKKEPKEKSEGGNKHTINIHVGSGGEKSEKKASAFFRGFGR